MISGGAYNTCTGIYTSASGFRARAYNAGAFVWGSSSTYGYTDSCDDYTVSFRCENGARFYTHPDSYDIGVTLAPGGGAWAGLSDVSQKENFRNIDTRAILNKVVSLPISEWNYKSQDQSIRHIGPMAQDFYGAFGLGDNNTTITTIDPDGISLAAIQELAKRTERIEELEARVKQLEEVILQYGELIKENADIRN